MGPPSSRVRSLFGGRTQAFERRPDLPEVAPALRRMAVMGVLNVTPDSFSDGGIHATVESACAHARRLIAEGADIIDVGGESSRPPGKTYGAGFAEVSVEEELARVIPVIERLRATTDTVLSVDTVKPQVAREALAAGASIVNDVSNGASEALLEVAAAHDATLVLMHTRDRGRVDTRTTAYEDVVTAVRDELMEAVTRAEARGISADHIVIDPGIGFAKNARQSAWLLGNLDVFVATGYPVLVGASRKSFIAELSARGGERPGPDARLGGSLAAVTAAALSGCAAVRVHDVALSVQAAWVGAAMHEGRGGTA